MSLLLLLAAWLGGAAATHLFDDDAPLLAFRDPARRRRLRDEAHGILARPGPIGLVAIFFYMGMAVLVWQVAARAMLFERGGIGTGVDHNLGDLPFHIAIVSSFVYGGNFPPEHPELAGVRLTYPFLVDFVAAMLMRAGASLAAALFSEGLVLGLCLVGVLHRWALLLTRDRLAGLVAPVVFLLSGGVVYVVIAIFTYAHAESEFSTPSMIASLLVLLMTIGVGMFLFLMRPRT